MSERRRVVVTGMGGITALGHDWPDDRARVCAPTQRHRAHGRVGPIPRAEHAARRARAGIRSAAAVQRARSLRTMGRVAHARDARDRDGACRMRGLRRRPGDRQRSRWASPTARPPAAPMRSATSAACSSTGDVERHQRHHLHPHDAAHRGGEHRRVLRPQGPRHPDLQRLHLGQPGHRLRLRGHPLRRADADGRGRRRGAVRDRGGGVRHAVRHQHAQRRAERRRRARSIAIATAW